MSTSTASSEWLTPELQWCIFGTNSIQRLGSNISIDGPNSQLQTISFYSLMWFALNKERGSYNLNKCDFSLLYCVIIFKCVSLPKSCFNKYSLPPFQKFTRLFTHLHSGEYFNSPLRSGWLPNCNGVFLEQTQSSGWVQTFQLTGQIHSSKQFHSIL